MASPSAGLTKEEIKERLAQMKKQYAQMQKKLEKSDKAARVKRHVSRKIADYKRKQSTGGSPECTISRADDLSTVTTGNTSSPSLSKDNKLCLSSEPKGSTSRKKRGKRRSVSFVLSPQSTPTSSRHNAVQGTEVASAISGDDRLGVNPQHDCRMSPEPHIQNASRPLKESGDAPNKILFRSGKSQKWKPVVVSSGEIGVHQSTDLNEGFVSTDHLNSEQCESGEKDEDIATDKSKTKSDPGDFNKPDKDSPDAKTHPEDTQFDLFADTDEQNESQHATEVLFHSPVNNDSASYDKMSAACAPMQAACSYGLNTTTTNQTEKEPQPNIVSGCRMNRHEDISQESVIILDETQIDIFQTQTTSRCSQNNEIEILESTGVQEAHPRSTSNTYSGAVTVKKSPSMMVSEPGYSHNNPLHVKLNEDKMVSGGHQDTIQSVPDDEGEDPDVIPSTFPEDPEPLTITKNNVSNQNSSTCYSDVMRTNCSQDRLPSPQIDEQKNDFQSSSKHIAGEKEDNSEYEMKGSCQATDVKEVDIAETKSRSSGNGGIVHNEDAQCILRNNDAKQDTNHVDPSSVHLYSQNILVNSQELTSQMIDTSPEGKGRTDTQKRTRRRKNQRSIDNLSVDDISLKDFVVSQQNSQEGNHTWIDGLMYPAEYYVRKTRSMSRPSPNLHSAPVLGQRLSKTSRGRKGSVTRTTPNGVMSEPVHTELPDAGKIQAGKEGSETVSSENLELGNNVACLSIEQSQDFVRGRQTEISESVHDRESHPPRKMKVLRKASTTKRKRGRKTSRKKLESDSECTITQATITSPTGAHSNSNNGQDEYQNERQDNCDHSEPTTTFYSDNALPNGEENRSTSSLCQLTGGLASQRNYTKDTISISSGLVCEGSKHFSITQMTNNPLESQFTQTQVPSNFALPKVFGSPGHSTQCPVGLSPGSPSSTPMNALCSPTLRPTASQHGDEMDPVQSREHRQHPEDIQECNEQQWMSEVYLADVVPEVPVNIDSEHRDLDSQHDIHAGRLSLDGCDISPSENPDRNEHILPTLQDDPIIDSKVSDILVKNGTRFVDSVIKYEHNLPEGHDQVSENVFSQLHVPFNNVQEDNKCASERTPSANDFKDKEPLTEHLPSSLPGGPSSLCSNINQGSPMADAATGTPPEVAEMPQAQSQCTDSLENGSEIDRHSVKEKSEDGFAVKECFQFKGCLKPKSEHSIDVQSIVSSVLVTDHVSEHLIAAVSPEEITFWVLCNDQDGKSFQALCSWRTNESALKVTMCAVLPGMTDVIEALVVVGGQARSHSVSLIRWDCKKARWNEYQVLSPVDGTSCTSLCVLQGKEAAVAIHKEAVGSEVQVIGLDAKNSEKRDFPVMTLPALKERINSLTVVEGADHMLLGMTNSEALLWHVSSHQLVQVFCLKDQKLNYSIEATAELGLLFVVACSKQHGNCKDHSEEPSCSLLVLNPLNGRSSTLLNYSAPCMQPGVRICDVSMCLDKTIAASLTNGHTCLWDLYSSHLLLETCLDPPQSSTPLCLLDAKTLLLGADGCVGIYERNF